MLVLLATGIACAAYAASWGRPLDVCDPSLNDGRDVSCDNDQLTATNSLEAVSIIVILHTAMIMIS